MKISSSEAQLQLIARLLSVGQIVSKGDGGGDDDDDDDDDDDGGGDGDYESHNHVQIELKDVQEALIHFSSDVAGMFSQSPNLSSSILDLSTITRIGHI